MTKLECLTRSPKVMMTRTLCLPALAWVGHRGQALSKLRLLTLSFFLLVRFARLLFRTGTRTGTT